MDKEFSDFISAVLDRTNIVDVVSRYVKLERKGGTYWACCPFHHEKTPSFAVNEERQFYHCFGCQVSGNALKFVQEMENIEFIDALKMLAERAGMELPKRSGGSYAKRSDKKEREALYSLMRDAARHYHDNLSQPRARRFTDYLNERQIPQSMVRRFGLGASLDYSEMVDFLKSKGYTFEQMHAAGIADSKDGRQYDVFGERLMYPIIDNMNRVVAFGGRTLEKEVHHAKYRNSTQTEIFDKSNVIYGINLLKKRKAERKIDYVIMTEGYMDVIALHKAGFDTAVASMGTALTQRQARQLKLYSDLVYISYDGDTAGQKATLRGLDILRENGLIVKVVRLPDGLDPDDLIKRGGAEAYSEQLERAVPLTAYKIDVLKSKYDLNDPDRKAMFAIEAARVVTALDNPVEQEQYLRYVSELTSFSVEALKRQTNMAAERERQQPQQRREPQPVSSGGKPNEYDPALKFFLASIAQGRDYVDFDYDVEGAMPDPFSQKLYLFCRENGRDAPKLLDNEFDDEYAPALNALFDYRFIDGDGKKKFVDIEKELCCRALEKEKAECNGRYKQFKRLEDLRRMGEIAVELAKLKNRD